MEKLWAMSGDSHFLEPEDLYTKGLPKSLADRAPRSERDGEWEVIHVDGQVIRRRVPLVREGEFKGLTSWELVHRAPGARDVGLRLKDLDQEGIWGELVYPSIGMWNQMIQDPVLAREMVRTANDWSMAEIQMASPRLLAAASVSMLSIDDAIDEVQRAATLGFKSVFIPTEPAEGQADFNRKEWDPFWAAVAETGLVLSIHIGTDRQKAPYRGPGGAILNYVHTSLGGQRLVCQLTSSGALERHPDLKVLVSEGGASWVPFLGDRMDESARQQEFWLNPKLPLLPSEYLYRQVYASFQHDQSAIPTYTHLGYKNVLWGSDYPHTEGTFGHTQETLHQLFDGVDEATRRQITIENFLTLFPSVGRPPVEVPV
jgi:predicted TIM-barrel fold metal-dependent hydrolase